MRTKRIELIFAKALGAIYLGITLSKRLQFSGLLRIIKAEELVECNPSSGHAKFNEPYKKSGKLEHQRKYLVHTKDLDRTLSLIKNYNNLNHNKV